MIRIVIADDHPIVRRGFVNVIADNSDMVVVGEASDGAQAVELIHELKPEIAVLDVSMPHFNGIEALRHLQGDNVRVIMLTMYDDDAFFKEAMNQGAWGYLLKECAVDELVRCIRQVVKGKRFVSPSLTDLLVRNGRKSNELNLLTQSELKVLRLISENYTSREIADELDLSLRTVQNHRANMCRKLEIRGYNKLLEYALFHRSDLVDV